MSDLLIRNFDPPKYGYREIRIHPNGRVTEVDECGLDEAVGMAEYIPPHGRLGDLDAIAQQIEHERFHHTHTDGLAARHHVAEYGHFLKAISDAPTIIPASEERT